MIYNLCCIGFGNVGKALARLLMDRSEELQTRYGIEWRITGVGTRRLGWLADSRGLDVAALLSGEAGPGIPFVPSGVHAWIEEARADVLFEMSSLDVVAGQPAIDYLCAALEAGAHAITANKGPVVHGYRLLRELAGARGKGFRFESTVMDGAPVFSLFRESLPAVRVLGFRGILNSTTNFILGEMELGRSLTDAIQQAQALGLAETDPSADVDGWDATVKVAALATVIMDTPTRPDAIAREGIRDLDPEAVRAARRAGTPFKLVCRAARVGDGVEASVRPEQVPPGDPLAQVSGTSSLVHFETDVLPGLTITEHSPTPTTTAYGMLADFVNLVRI